MSKNIPYTVGFVADPSFGAGLSELALRMHVWVIDSPENKATAQSFWKQHPEQSTKVGLTTFTPSGHPAEQDLFDQLDTIEEHHPGFNCFEIFGVPMSDRIRTVLTEVGFSQFSSTTQGFKAEKSSS
jgi:hypothetical protein